MTLTELIDYVGLDNVVIEPIHTNATGAKQRKGGEVEVSFLSTQCSVADFAGFGPRKKLGLVVWLPVDKLPESMR